jgi:hypothetical protein
VPNGITHVRWSPGSAARLRVVMTRRAGDPRPIRLVEFKAF